MTRLAMLLLAATALASPASAEPVEPCPPGEVGVVVVDDEGEVAEVCVRRDLVPNDPLAPIRNCPPRNAVPKVTIEGDFIVIEGGPADWAGCIQNG